MAKANTVSDKTWARVVRAAGRTHERMTSDGAIKRATATAEQQRAGKRGCN